ncbi:EcsC protein family protein [Evansella caseinilytica]|uniref:EcsC protein family protein n=1 Tax=Evansella caseinilytica TaxID=1503961 RepID=A0A1H3K223_9BACI|nr:EcsC family protein [Evansella caseinilytica]SDY46270.1 EcsC protein family protein [Evansella caseinilytica]
MDFQDKIDRELRRWERKVLRPLSATEKMAKGLQNKLNDKIPEKIHRAVSESVKQMVRATLLGSDYLSEQKVITNMELKEREKILADCIERYKRTAAVEGAGTGLGGIVLGMADFPLLLSIKMKFLFDAAKIYGFDVSDYRERLFLLTIFQLAFSKESKKREAFEKIIGWEEQLAELPAKEVYLDSIDWKAFQLEYRDFIDLPKMLQLIPGFGAIVGAVANYHYLDILAEHAKNSCRYRLRKRNG